MKIYLLSLSVFFSAGAMACDVCGSFMGITPYDNQSQVTFLHRYRVFNGYRNYQQTSKFFNPGAYRIMHNPGGMNNDSVTEVKNYSSKDYETFKIFELRAKYFLHPRWEVNVILPFQQIKTKYDGEKNTNTGVVDPSLFLAHHLIRRLSGYNTKQRLIVGAGVKFPVGDYLVKNWEKQRMSLLTQNGTGSWDQFYYLNYIVSQRLWGISSNSLFKINGTNALHEKLADSYNQILSVFMRLEAGNVKLFPAVLLNYEYSKGLIINKKVIDATNTNVLLCGPSLDVNIKKITLNASYQFNVYERVSSQTLSNAGRFVIGLTFNFSQDKYLVNNKN